MASDEDWIESALRESEEPYVDNGTFSRDVMAALPRAKRRTRISRRKQIVFGSGCVGSVLTWPLVSGGMSYGTLLGFFASGWALTLGAMGMLAVVALSAWWLLAVRE